MTCATRPGRSGANTEEAAGRGLADALLIAIPLWVFVGIVLVAVFQQGPVGEICSATLMIAAACELVLARPYVHAVCSGFQRRAAIRRAGLRRIESAARERPVRQIAIVPNGILRQSLLLSALVGAYLQYYFLDVHLQIASMHSVTVFVPVS